MKISDFVGKYVIHKDYGRVFVVGAPPRSKVMVNITVMQRGKGWNENKEEYEKYFIGSFLQRNGSRSLRWGFTRRDEYGQEEQVHINSLSKFGS